MRWLVVVSAVAVLAACYAPWAGPSLPDGSRPLSLNQLRSGPPDVGPDIVASNSVDTVRINVVRHAAQFGVAKFGRPVGWDPCQQFGPEACWASVAGAPGNVYIAVITNYECNADEKEVTAIEGHVLYIVHWYGGHGGVCNAALAEPVWRLYYARRADLPTSGTLTVRLQLQGDQNASIDSTVTL